MSRGRALLASLLASGTMGACGSPSPHAQVPATTGAPVGQDSVVVEGEVSVVGAEPLTQLVLRTPSGTEVAVVGDLRTEIGSLVGLVVRVSGRPAGPAPPVDRAVWASGYQILAMGGEPVYVGVLEHADGTLRLRGDSTWVLVGVPPDLASRAGAKVWVAGPQNRGVVTVHAFGVIATPLR